MDKKIKVLFRSDLQKILDYRIIKLNFKNIKEFTNDNFNEIIKQILIKYKVWNNYKDLIESINIQNIKLPIDLRFNNIQQILYTIILKPNDLYPIINDKLILDLRVNYNDYKKNCI